jgi:hypothetical protein
MLALTSEGVQTILADALRRNAMQSFIWMDIEMTALLACCRFGAKL